MSKSKNYNNDLYRILWQFAKNIRIEHKTKCWEYRKKGIDNYIGVKTHNSDYFQSNSTHLHRFVYAVYHNKPLKPTDVIMHKCDNRICVNPKHLQLGTILENNQDRAKKQKKRPK